MAKQQRSFEVPDAPDVGVWSEGQYLAFRIVHDKMTGKLCVTDPREKPAIPKARLRQARLDAVTKAKAAGLL